MVYNLKHCLLVLFLFSFLFCACTSGKIKNQPDNNEKTKIEAAVKLFKEGKYDDVIDLTSNLKSTEAKAIKEYSVLFKIRNLYEPSKFDDELFNVLPEIMSCGENNEIELLSVVLQSDNDSVQIEIQTEKICKEIDENVKKEIEKIKNNTDTSKRTVIGRRSCEASTASYKTIVCAKKIIESKLEFLPPKSTKIYHLYLSLKLKKMLLQ